MVSDTPSDGDDSPDVTTDAYNLTDDHLKQSTQFDDLDELQAAIDAEFEDMPEKMSVRIPDAHRRYLAYKSVVGDTTRSSAIVSAIEQDAAFDHTAPAYDKRIHSPSVQWRMWDEPFECPDCGNENRFMFRTYATDDQRGTVATPQSRMTHCTWCGYVDTGSEFIAAALDTDA